MRAILITGGGRRVGREIARQMGLDGWHVLIHYRRSATDAADVARSIAAEGGTADIVGADLENLDDVAMLMAEVDKVTRARGSRLTALVNNASTFEYDTFDSMTAASWAKHMDANLRGPLFLSKLFADRIPDGNDGCIINILDNKITAPNPDYFSYTISKLGLAGATEVLALALAPRIRVCGIAPGITLVSGNQTEEEFARAHRANPLGQGCTVDQIARAVQFILAARSMTGQVLVIDGGQSLAKPPRDVAYS